MVRASGLCCVFSAVSLLAGCPPPGGGAPDAGFAVEIQDSGSAFEIVDGGADAGFDLPCVEDGLEENDTPAAASAVVAGAPVAARFCGGDDDWYAIDVDGADCAVAVAVVITADPVGGEGDGEGEGDGDGEGEGEGDKPDEPVGLGDLDLILVDAAGGLVASATGLGPREALNVRVPAAGRYAVRVRGGGEDDVSYDIVVDTACAGDEICPADDAREDNDSAAAAVGIDRGVAADLAACPADEDFFTLPVAAGCIADVRTGFVDADGDIDIAIKRLADNTEIARSNGTSDNERITKVLVDPAGAVLQVKLFGDGGARLGNGYRLTVDQVCLNDLACPGDDLNEPNDTRQTAKSIDRDDEVLGVACGVNPDFYRVVPQSGCTTTFAALFSHAVGDLDLNLVDGADAVLQSSASTDDDEQISFVAPNGSAVFLKVFGFQTAQSSYRLRTTTTCP